ncbi:hypothetical protein JAAARDRAFT_135819, partial [Jaapia argillacea MUCL 33604]
RLMLILFKPWRSVRDLRKNGESWKEAFVNFLPECPARLKAIMDNMQIWHECRDSRDGHFKNRRLRHN